MRWTFQLRPFQRSATTFSTSLRYPTAMQNLFDVQETPLRTPKACLGVRRNFQRWPFQRLAVGRVPNRSEPTAMQNLGEVQDTPVRDPLLWVEWMVHAEPFHVAASPIWPT